MTPLASPPPLLTISGPLGAPHLPPRGPFRGSLGLPLRPCFVRGELFVGDFVCPGNEVGAEATDYAPHLHIWLQRVGSHTRQTGRVQVVADPARALVQRPTETYRVRYPSSAPQRGRVLLLAGGLADEALAGGGRACPHAVALSPRASLLEARLQCALAPGQSDELAAEELGLAFVREVLGGAATRPDPAGGGAWQRRRAVERIEHLLAAQYAERLTLEAIARHAGLSPFYAAHLFREVTGTPIHRHLTAIRLRVALSHLGERRHDLAGLAFDVGFASHSHFSAAFRRHFGVSPSRALAPAKG